MRKPVKSLALTTILLLSFSLLQAQLKLTTGGMGNDIKKVIEDYPNRFGNLKGELIMENPQSTDYQCNFKVSGAETSSITYYTSKYNNVCSWQATVLTTESFDKARQKFKSLFSQLNNLSVRPGEGSYKLKGDYEAPAEEKKFCTVLFSLDKAEDPVSKLKVELTMEYELLEWKIKVLVYDREREDDERGKTRED